MELMHQALATLVPALFLPCTNHPNTSTYPTSPPTLTMFTLPPRQGVPLPNYCLETSEGREHDAQGLMVKGFMSSLGQSGRLGWLAQGRAGQGRWGSRPMTVHCVREGQGQRLWQHLLRLKPNFILSGSCGCGDYHPPLSLLHPSLEPNPQEMRVCPITT